MNKNVLTLMRYINLFQTAFCCVFSSIYGSHSWTHQLKWVSSAIYKVKDHWYKDHYRSSKLHHLGQRSSLNCATAVNPVSRVIQKKSQIILLGNHFYVRREIPFVVRPRWFFVVMDCHHRRPVRRISRIVSAFSL